MFPFIVDVEFFKDKSVLDFIEDKSEKDYLKKKLNFTTDEELEIFYNNLRPISKARSIVEHAEIIKDDLLKREAAEYVKILFERHHIELMKKNSIDGIPCFD